jgi:hypothetical protein
MEHFMCCVHLLLVHRSPTERRKSLKTESPQQTNYYVFFLNNVKMQTKMKTRSAEIDFGVTWFQLSNLVADITLLTINICPMFTRGLFCSGVKITEHEALFSVLHR